MTVLSGWENFYVIVGSSAGALIGLQFVVMTLIADIPMRDGAAEAGNAFGTPTIVHFGAVLLLSGLLNAPWRDVVPAAISWGILGAAGVVYAILITRRMRTQNVYKPELEDWIFHSVLPLVAYAILTVAAFTASAHPRGSLFAVAAASMFLLFDGIHNAWDAVTYHVYSQRKKQHGAEAQAESNPL